MHGLISFLRNFLQHLNLATMRISGSGTVSLYRAIAGGSWCRIASTICGAELPEKGSLPVSISYSMNDYFSRRLRPTQSQLRFWFSELTELLLELADAYPALRKKLIGVRPLLSPN